MFGGVLYSDHALLNLTKRNHPTHYPIPTLLQSQHNMTQTSNQIPTLYWNIASQPSRAVKALLDIGKIPCKYIQVDLFKLEQRKPTFLSINPMGTVPTLVHGELRITESVAILVYLCERFPEALGTWYGETVEERAGVNQWLSWCQSYLRPNLGALFSLQKQKGLRQRKPLLPQQLTLAQSKITQALETLDTLLSQKSYLTNSKPSIADLMLYFQVTILVYHGKDHYKYANIERWFKNVYAIPEVKMVTHQWFSLAQQMGKMLAALPVKRGSL